MTFLLDELKRKKDLYGDNAASREVIEEAEKALGLRFADEYKVYLQEYGSVSCSGHELTGICDDSNYDVVKVTLRNRELNPNINLCLYVIEETHIDGIVIWQSVTGEVYQSEYKEPPVKVFESLAEYVSHFENREGVNEEDD